MASGDDSGFSWFGVILLFVSAYWVTQFMRSLVHVVMAAAVHDSLMRNDGAGDIGGMRLSPAEEDEWVRPGANRVRRPPLVAPSDGTNQKALLSPSNITSG